LCWGTRPQLVLSRYHARRGREAKWFMEKIANGEMKQAHWHQFQILSKLSERLLELSQYLEWTPMQCSH
jgi:protein gp37